MAAITRRDVLVVYILSIVTFGIYFIVWMVKTKTEMNSLGAQIPTAWLLIVPIANIYWLYKYAEAFSTQVKKDNNTVMWFLLFWFIGIIMPAIVQSELNKLAG
ncbi:MAG: DUF4234 domain-containing protein [Candidatus Aminicenantes bacterium]|nr:DUF4234 domain-containing protein [Candidatus Aminicenantes bacterium]